MKSGAAFSDDMSFSINGVQTAEGIKYRLDEAQFPPLPEVLISVTFQGVAEDDRDSGLVMSIKQKEKVRGMLQDILELLNDMDELPEEEIKAGVVVPFKRRH